MPDRAKDETLRPTGASTSKAPGVDELKRAAAERAVDGYVGSGMVVGLGTGSTAAWVVQRIGELLRAGELSGVRGIPTSQVTAELAAEYGVPLVALDEARPDLTIDGADEIDPRLALIKGRGGALLREKIVAAAGRGLVVVADGSKEVVSLGEGTLPVEVEPFGWRVTLDSLSSLGCEPRLRLAPGGTAEPEITDGGHYTADCAFGDIPEPGELEREIRRIPGAIESGLFVGLSVASVVSRASDAGGIDTRVTEG